MVALSLLVSGLDGELVRLGYKDSTMLWYRGSGPLRSRLMVL